MLRRPAPVLLCVSALLCSAHFSAAGVALRVDESRSRFFFDDEDKTAGASLLVMNPTAREFAARVFVELLDTEDGVRSKGERVASLRPGTNSVKTELPFSVATSGDADRLPWYRLRYRVAPEGDAAPAPSEGVVSLSEINPDFFELQVSGPQYTFEGTRYRARVRATHPASHLPVKGVRVSGEAELDDPDAPLRASATTDEDGYAALDFDLPGSFREDHLGIAVKGRLGGFERSAEDTVSVVRMAEVLVSTDKPIYQPGQTLHVRALVIDTRARRAVADADVVFSVRDPAGTRVFTGTVRTSRFGVASCDWPIAEGTRLGDYFVEADIEGERYDDSSGGQYVRVSRYELPNFAVKVEPDRKFYLPGENAKVTVRADYLFGQPIRRGRVRVVREAERVWNFARQKWDVTEGETFEGETDADGRFVARIDLGEAHSDLGVSGRPARFNDLNYAAYFTDPTTNRTEQRRFDLRVTREAIHVYVVEPSYDDSQTAGFPLEFYVSTFYADGTPASCAVAVADPRPPVRIASLSSTPLAPALFEVKTNDFGFAKVNRLTLAPRAPEEGETEDDDVTLRFTARDAKGRTGTASEEFDLAERTVIRVDTDKAIYRAGEPVRARISSNRRELPVAVDVFREQKVVYSTSVRLHGGRASLSIPAGREFRNQLTVAAYALPEAHDDDRPDLGTHTVIFPRGRELQFDVRLDKQEYRPGEEARAEVRLRDADGREIEGALGFVVTDRAVDERARTDREFGGSAGGGFSDYVLGTLGAGEGLAGVTRRDLDRLDLAKPLPPGLDLLAEVMLNRSNSFGLNTFGHGFARNQRRMFAAPLAATLKPLGEALDARPVLSGDYPRDEADLRRMLAEGGVRLEDLRDPWGTPFRVWLGTIEGEDVLEVITAAADKRAGTGDDFIALRRGWPYFHHTGAAIERALRRHHARTGALIKDRAALRRELLAEGIDFGALRDRWGRPYELQTETNRSDFILRVQSAGPDTRFGARHAADDFTISTARVNYFERVRQLVNAALDGAIGRGDSFPADEAALRALLSREGADERLLLDPWGRPYRLVFGERAWMSGRFVIRSYARHGEQPKDKAVDAGPVTLRLHSFAVYSLGLDGQAGTYDDFHLGNFARVLDQTNAPPQPTLRQTVSFQSGANAGTLNGVVTDANGAVIANAAVHATHAGTGAVRTATANGDGAFVLDGLAAGIHEVRFEALGFKIALITSVVVKAGEVTTMEVILEPGAVTETVTVTAEAMVVDSTSASIIGERQIQNLPLDGRNQLSLVALRPGAAAAQAATPRLREYFPETLVWQPSVETDAGGRARLQFKLADNITTWKMALIGSTLDGRLGVAETEIRAFQPFFAEHDPPRVLTEGDEIALPVVLRNYLDRAQRVEVEMKPEGWFALLGPARQGADVPAGDAARAVFDFRAVAPVREGRQRVTALGPEESDAVEKPVSVHPDGAEVSKGETQVFGGAGALDFDFPAGTIAGTARAELKLYPNLLSHVIEGVEGIMRRPYGCGEQTISSTYPSLLVLRHRRRPGAAAGELPAAARRAEHHVRAGYERLLGYQHDGGAFTYWGGASEPDLALTAYALHFLHDAGEVLEVDEDATRRARNYVLGQQQPDGSWSADAKAPAHTLALTAYVARVLASYEAAKGANDKGAHKTDAETAKASDALKRALDFLSRHAEKTADPYALASYALAARDSGRHEAARAAAVKLAALRRDVAGDTFWDTTNTTPFNGWGHAGRIEATALVLKALIVNCGVATADCGLKGVDGGAAAASANRQLINGGLLYLLRHKDEHGVWYSTQATVNVLDALATLQSNPSNDVARDAQAAAASPRAAAAEVFVNSRHVGSLALPAEGDLSAPLSLDITRFVNAPGVNRVEIKRPAGAGRAAAQVVTNYYVPWSDAPDVAPLTKDARGTGAPTGAHAAGRPLLKLAFDRTEGQAGRPVTCRVEVSRGASLGGGMLLAEVGLPPGAEVDRASLERASKKSGAFLDRYDVLPDRLVLYVWPHQDKAASFEFAFTPRYGLRALTAPSQVYDYYNPEARTVVPPTRFVIR